MEQTATNTKVVFRIETPKQAIDVIEKHVSHDIENRSHVLLELLGDSAVSIEYKDSCVTTLSIPFASTLGAKGIYDTIWQLAIDQMKKDWEKVVKENTTCEYAVEDNKALYEIKGIRDFKIETLDLLLTIIYSCCSDIAKEAWNKSKSVGLVNYITDSYPKLLNLAGRCVHYDLVEEFVERLIELERLMELKRLKEKDNKELPLIQSLDAKDKAKNTRIIKRVITHTENAVLKEKAGVFLLRLLGGQKTDFNKETNEEVILSALIEQALTSKDKNFTKGLQRNYKNEKGTKEVLLFDKGCEQRDFYRNDVLLYNLPNVIENTHYIKLDILACVFFPSYIDRFGDGTESIASLVHLQEQMAVKRLKETTKQKELVYNDGKGHSLGFDLAVDYNRDYNGKELDACVIEVSNLFDLATQYDNFYFAKNGNIQPLYKNPIETITSKVDTFLDSFTLKDNNKAKNLYGRWDKENKGSSLKELIYEKNLFDSFLALVFYKHATHLNTLCSSSTTTLTINNPASPERSYRKAMELNPYLTIAYSGMAEFFRRQLKPVSACYYAFRAFSTSIEKNRKSTYIKHIKWINKHYKDATK